MPLFANNEYEEGGALLEPTTDSTTLCGKATRSPSHEPGASGSLEVPKREVNLSVLIKEGVSGSWHT